MKIPSDILSKYKITDEDTVQFLNCFDEDSGLRVLEVGAHDEPVANILTDCGYRVTGIDLREYNPDQDTGNKEPSIVCNYQYIRADFCDLPAEFLCKNIEMFDIAISLSAIEHFGLSTYNEGPQHLYYDVIALRQIWQLLKPNGVCYLTVPFGGKHHDVGTHWRIYNKYSIEHRLVQDFTVEWASIFIAAAVDIDGKIKNIGDNITIEEVERYIGQIPHISILLKLVKRPLNRLAPDGR